MVKKKTAPNFVGKVLWFGKGQAVGLFAKHVNMFVWKGSKFDFYAIVLEHHVLASGKECLYVFLPESLTQYPAGNLPYCWIIIDPAEEMAMNVVA